ncbi:MAG: hypothetical protein P9L99_15575 [Candidatus Lernaella stagnicola]|nr:hypothetical protein [Candidatus Lernaella stagnicola]
MKSKLKKEVKTFVLSDVDASLKEYEGTDLDPGKEIGAVAVYGDKDYDGIATSLAKMELGLTFAQNVLKDTDAKLAEVKDPEELDKLKKNNELAQKALEALMGDGAKLVASATSFTGGLQGKIKEDPMGYGKYGADMGKTMKKTKKVVDQIKPTIDQLIATVGKITEKGKAMAADATAE